jgi:AcrR family transcriptional regulator
MSARRRTLPRKAPKQQRAKFTVDAILDATARILVERGFAGATTNRIAETAGVSIGSLYQYFPSKEALVAALVEEHLGKMNGLLATHLEAVTGSDLASDTRRLVNGLIAAYRWEPRLHHVLCQEVPKVGELRRVYEFEQRLGEVAREQLHGLRSRIGHGDVETAIFVLVNAVPSILRAAVQRDAEGYQDELLASEVTQLILRYLLADTASAMPSVARAS